MELQNATFHQFQMLKFGDLVKLKIVNNRVTLSRWVKAGTFPSPIKLGENSIGWRARDVQEWLDRRAAVMDTTTEGA